MSCNAIRSGMEIAGPKGSACFNGIHQVTGIVPFIGVSLIADDRGRYAQGKGETRQKKVYS